MSSIESGSKRLEWRLPGVGVEKSSEAFSMSVKDVAEWVFAGSKEYFLGNIEVFLWGIVWQRQGATRKKKWHP